MWCREAINNKLQFWPFHHKSRRGWWREGYLASPLFSTIQTGILIPTQGKLQGTCIRAGLSSLLPSHLATLHYRWSAAVVMIKFAKCRELNSKSGRKTSDCNGEVPAFHPGAQRWHWLLILMWHRFQVELLTWEMLTNGNRRLFLP